MVIVHVGFWLDGVGVACVACWKFVKLDWIWHFTLDQFDYLSAGFFIFFSTILAAKSILNLSE